MASRSWNRVELIGNLTRDPELRYTPNGAAVCTIGLATNRTYTTADGEKKEEVDFHRIVCWGKLAEICNQYLKKGSKIFLSGRLQYREWEPQEGQKRRDAEISMEDMIMLSSKPAGDYTEKAIEDVFVEEKPKAEPKTEKAAEAPKEETPKEEVSDDDLPF